MVFGQDASFSDEAFVDRYNSDLANDLGNTASRLVKLSREAFSGRTPPEACGDNPLLRTAEEVVVEYRRAMDELQFQSALRVLWRLLSETNQYLVGREPWKRIKQEGATPAISRILWNGLEAVRVVAVGLIPVMPQLAERLLLALGCEAVPTSLEALRWGQLPTAKEIPPLEPLFPRMRKEFWMEEIKSSPASDKVPTAGSPLPVSGSEKPSGEWIDLAMFQRVELRVGVVVKAERVPKSEKLLRLEVDLGPEAGGVRQVLAGLARQYAPESLVGRQVVLVVNLKPARLMGLESQGMVLAAVDPAGNPVLLRPDDVVPPGSTVR
jgi:methionyl-tRNA synthetase